MHKEAGSSAGQRRRDQIVRTAYALIVDHGQVTIQMVADKIKITDAAVLYHFKTKEQLLVSVLQYVDEQYEGVQSEIDQIDRAVMAMYEFEATPTLMSLFADMASRAADAQHPAHDYFVDRYTRVQDQLAAAAAARLPDRSRSEIEEIVRTFLAAIDGLQRRWMVQHNFRLGESARHAEALLFGPSAPFSASSNRTGPLRVLPAAD